MLPIGLAVPTARDEQGVVARGCDCDGVDHRGVLIARRVGILLIGVEGEGKLVTIM